MPGIAGLDAGGSQAGAFLGRQLAPERLRERRDDGGGIIERANAFESLALGRLGVSRRAQREGQAKRVERGVIAGVAEPGAEPTTPGGREASLRNAGEGRELAAHGGPVVRAVPFIEGALQEVETERERRTERHDRRTLSAGGR
jgi:hypothetical protein